MSDVKKIATRDSYGNALAELGAEAQRSGCSGCRPGSGYKGQVYLRKHFRSATLTAVLQSVT